MNYHIHERFLTFQGEGDHMGHKAFFLRTYGCPVHCPFCDSAGTWHSKWKPKEVLVMNEVEILNEVLESNAHRVVITGGEPAMFKWDVLIDMLNMASVSVHLETSGAFPIQGKFDWITLSPKRWKLPLPENVARANEFKIIVCAPEDIGFYYQILGGGGYSSLRGVGPSIWLHPEWSQRNNPQVLKAISNTVKESLGVPFRAGYQIHKLYRVDAEDPRSAPLVPLGGLEKNGF